MADSDDLVTTVDLIKSRGRRVFADEVDVRDLQSLEAAVAAGISELGRLDIVVANADTLNDTAPLWEITEQQFQDQIDVNLTGMWKTIKATVPTLLKQNEGGVIILISSISGLTVELNVGHYAASKHGGEWINAHAVGGIGAVRHSRELDQPNEREHRNDRAPRRIRPRSSLVATSCGAEHRRRYDDIRAMGPVCSPMSS